MLCERRLEVESEIVSVSNALAVQWADADSFNAAVAKLSPVERAQARTQRVVGMQQLTDMAWVDVMEQVWHLRNDVVMQGGETRYAWQMIAPDQNWTQYAMDSLGLCRSDTSLVPNVWDTFVVSLGYTRLDLLRAGVARLKHSVGYVRGIWDGSNERNYELEQAVFGALPDVNAYEVLADPEIESVVLEYVPEPESVVVVDGMIAEARNARRGGAVTISIAIDHEAGNGEDELPVVAWRDGLAFDVGTVRFNRRPPEGMPWEWADVSWRELVNAVLNRLSGRIRFD